VSAVLDWDPAEAVTEPLPRAVFVPTVLDATDAPDDAAAWAAFVEPGPSVVAPLRAAMDRGLSESGRVDALVAIARQRAWLEAQQVRLLNEMSDAATDAMGKDWVREDVACALRMSPLSAAARLEFARQMHRLPATLTALEHGQITELHARSLAEAAAPLSDEVAATLERDVIAKARMSTVGEFRRTVRKAVLRLTAAAAEERHQSAREQRRVVFTPVDDGMEEMWALLPAERAAALRARLDADASTKLPGDARTADQRRADALCDLADASDPLAAGATRPAVQVSVALSTLLGLDDEPGELAGHGPISAPLARTIAHDPTGTWRRILTDDFGRLLDYARATYRPPAALAGHVVARDRTCRFPGCGRPATRCEIDHRLAWDDGGTTEPANLYTLCARHHHLKHEAGWSYEVTADDDTVWTSPTGHIYMRRRASYPVDRTAARLSLAPDDPDPPLAC